MKKLFRNMSNDQGGGSKKGQKPQKAQKQEETPENPARRGFLGAAGATAAAAATGGVGHIAKAAAVAGAASVSTTTNIKLAGYFKGLLRNWEPNRKLGLGDRLELLQRNIRGVGEWGRYKTHPEKPIAWRDNKIDFSKQRSLLNKLEALPRDESIKTILSKTNIEEIGYGGDSDGAVLAENFRELLFPLCDDTTTPKDLIGSFRGFFENLAQHAIKNPNDFVISGSSEGMLPVDENNIRIHDDELEQLIRELKSFERADGVKSPALEQLKDVHKNYKKAARQRFFKSERKRFDAIKAKEDAERKAEDVRLRAEREQSAIDREAERKARKEEQKANPNTRSERSIALKHIEGNKFMVLPDDKVLPLPARMDWFHWLQKHNPDAKPHHIEL